MPSEHVGKTVILEVVPPKKVGQRPVGFWKAAKKTSYTVFLPSSAQTGKRVRVVLQDTGNLDVRHMELFDGQPAPEEFTERWKDNGDGTASRVKIGIDWTFTEREVEKIETRKLETKEGTPSTQKQMSVNWGTDLATTKIEDYEVSSYPQFVEKIVGVLIQWNQTGTRQTQTTPVQYPVIAIASINKQWAIWAHEALIWNDDLRVRLDLTYLLNGESKIFSVTLDWGKVEPWVQTLLQKSWPVCSCGRQRVDPPDAGYQDHYPRCSLCRAKERCAECNKKGDVVQQADGRLLCFNCHKAAEQEKFINEHLSAQQRKELADFARRLRVGQALEKEAALAILGATLGHVNDQKRQQLLEKWSKTRLDHYWYYFTPEGVFGTKLPPNALLLVEYLPEASGAGFVEMVTWLTGDAMSTRGDDYYWQTQVQKIELHPDHRMTALQVLKTGSLQVAERLRGSEDDRIAAVIGYSELVKTFGENSDQAKEVANILQGDAQDYAAALVKINEAQQLLEGVKSGTALLDFAVVVRHKGQNDQSDGWVINKHGELVPPTFGEGVYAGEGQKVWKFVGPDDLALRWQRHQAGGQFIEIWEVVKLPVAGITGWQQQTALQAEPHERFRGEGTGWDLSQVGAITVSVSRTEQELPMRTISTRFRKSARQISCEVNGWPFQVLGPKGYEQAELCGGWSPPYPLEVTEEVQEVEETLQKLDRHQARVEIDREALELAYLEALEAAELREKAEWMSRKVFHPQLNFPAKRDEKKPDEVFTVIFHEERRRVSKTEETVQLVTDVFYDAQSGTWMKFVEFVFSNIRPIAGRQYLVRVHPKNSTQVHLFEFTADDPQSGKVRGKGYFAEIIPDPEHFELVAAQLEQEKAVTLAKLQQLHPSCSDRRKSEREVLTDEDDGETESAMEFALRQAMQKRQK